MLDAIVRDETTLRTRMRALIAKRRPGYTLPQAFYTDQDVYEFDLAAIFHRQWIMAGFEVELSEPGSYLAFDVGRTPVVIVRGREGELRAFHNSCRHRGAQVCETGTGRRARLVCPYHQWAYDLDGRLVNAVRMTVNTAELGLRPVHVRAVAGSLYVCLADDPPPFDDFATALEPLLAPHRLDRAKVAATRTLVEKANWKLVMENGRECYHCAARHPELAVTFPVRVTGNHEYGDPAHQRRFVDRMAAAGLPTGPVDGDGWQAQRFALNPGVTALTRDGKPEVKRLLLDLEGGDLGSLRWAREPHMFCHAVADSVFMFSANPTGPEETVVTAKWLVHADAVEGVDYDVDRLTDIWMQTNLQDRDLAENNQRGVRGAGYLPGPYAPQEEALVMAFVDWYLRRAESFLDSDA